MAQAELKEHSSSFTSYVVRRLEQRQAAEGGTGVSATKLSSILINAIVFLKGFLLAWK